MIFPVKLARSVMKQEKQRHLVIVAFVLAINICVAIGPCISQNIDTFMYSISSYCLVTVARRPPMITACVLRFGILVQCGKLAAI